VGQTPVTVPYINAGAPGSVGPCSERLPDPVADVRGELGGWRIVGSHFSAA
jgi:hypothetical protein